MLAGEAVDSERPATAATGTLPAAPSFELDIQPILTKAGCNAGACHGKQRGQNGFQLSLLAFDSDFDYQQILQGGRGRRVFPAAPERSLLLAKAVGAVPHGGGKRLEVGSPHYNALLEWIAAGAPRRSPGESQLVGIALETAEFTLQRGQNAALSVTAHYSDGSSRDVTALADYLSNEAVVASVDGQGRITAGELPGETAIMVRYMNHIAVAGVVIPYGAGLGAEYYRDLPRNNFIDDLVYAKWERAGLAPSAPASDATFLRRVFQDLIGRFPTAEEAREFLTSTDPNKRERLVDSLLDRPEYIDYWANQWADLLRPNPYRVGIKAVLNYDNWIRDQFRRNVPYDEFVRGLVTARGSTWRNGAATLYRDRRSPDEMATLVSRLFLGIRLECAKCHHHPFEKWSQRDFYQFAGFFAQVGFKGTGLSPPISGGEEVVYSKSTGNITHPRTGEVLQALPLFSLPDAENSAAQTNAVGSEDADATDPRYRLWRWMTSPGNNYFAQVHANRMWAALMGRGLVEPVDDLRSTNPPSNPELLQALGDFFRDSGFDQRALLRAIALSRVYSLSSLPTSSNVADRLNYSRHYRHRLRAEVLMDAIADFTETDHEFSAMPAASRATQIWTHRIGSTFLDTFGRPDPNQDPPCERTSDSTVRQTLHLMNSQEVNGRLGRDSGRAARLAASGLEADAIVEELYLAGFSRFPTEDERQVAVAAIRAAGENRRQAIEDLMWAMMNSAEFYIQD
ncbi:MAG: DUF1549 domain-containing protein [Planctomycetota bacterium]|nr:MAG: DUF1549 domain-containing protein [Planctomycetota bacterium]